MVDQHQQEEPHVESTTAPEVSRCPVCGSADLTDFFEVERLPVHCCVLWERQEQARNAPTGGITLSFCHGCGFVHNRIFDPRRISFEPGYEASLFHSKLFRSFIHDIASRLIERYDIRNKTVLEIGCGAGDFLRLLCKLGKNNGIGIDPTIKRKGIEEVGQGSVRFIRDYFSDSYADLQSDFICCLSVFEDIPGPLNFLKSIRKMIGERLGVGLYFEVPNASYYFSNQATWSIYYEQCNHFTKATLTNLFEICGFEVLEAATCYEDGQYVYVEAVPSYLSKPNVEPLCEACSELPEALKKFSDHHQKNIATWMDRLEVIKRTGKRAVAWGSGGKGIGFLNTLKTENLIPYVVDINPNRQGKYVPGSAQKIVAPEFLGDYRPDTLIITNPLYEKEIKNQVMKLGVTCNFLIV